MCADSLSQLVVRTCNDTVDLTGVTFTLSLFSVVLRTLIHPMALPRQKEPMIAFHSLRERIAQLNAISRLQNPAKVELHLLPTQTKTEFVVRPILNCNP